MKAMTFGLAVAVSIVGCGGVTKTGEDSRPAAAGGARSKSSGGTTGKGGGGITGMGGSGGVPGSGGSAGAIANGGAGGFGQGIAGAFPVGGAPPIPGCPELPCPQVDCPFDSEAYFAPDGCCPICGSSCSAVDCASPTCLSDWQLAQRLPGQCCPVCTTDVPPFPSCDTAGYASLRHQLEQQYQSVRCSSDAECTVVVSADCGFGDCGMAIHARLADSFRLILRNFAEAHCVGCGSTPATMCPTGKWITCLDGRCAIVDQLPK